MLYNLVMDSVSDELVASFKKIIRGYFEDGFKAEDVLDLAYEEDVPEEVKEFSQIIIGLMTKEAFGWIRAGSSVNLTDVLRWHKSERYCYKLAGELYEGRQAFVTGMASQGPFQAAQFLSAIDDGKFHDEMILDHYADKMADMMS